MHGLFRKMFTTEDKIQRPGLEPKLKHDSIYKR